MSKTFFFENVNILMGPNTRVTKENLLIIDGKIKAFGDEFTVNALHVLEEYMYSHLM